MIAAWRPLQACGRAAMGWRRDARRTAAHHAAQAAAADAEVASHVAFRSPKWQLTFFHAVEGGRTPGSSRPGRWLALPHHRNRLSLMPWRRRRCPRRRRPRTGSSAATGCCRGRTFTRGPWAPRAACRRRPRAGSCPEDPPGHGFIRSLRSWNAERYEEQHGTATGSIRATARQQQSKKHGEHAPLGMKRIRPAGKSRSTPTGTVRGTMTCKTNFMSRGSSMSRLAITTKKRSITPKTSSH